MSTGQTSRHRSRSSASKNEHIAKSTPPPQTSTPDNPEQDFDPCAATASFLLYSQRNVILVLHHDTLAIERRFDLHREDVLWIQVDNCSERGSGRLAVSYDAGNTAIVWDIITGGELARFSSYERMRVACFMRNGNIAFGNDQGNVILFEPRTSEHISARTIYDPVTAIAPAADCRTFAIGYLNGSILVTTLQPSFTILHTLTTTRPPARIVGLSWHGSSSRQKTDMLATQTSEGDLRVWSVPKAPLQDPPNIIRILQMSDSQTPGRCWSSWSKNGRIVQHAFGETRSWDVRTKKVTYEVIPTVENVAAIACFGPTSTLFTLSRDHIVQQYDITPNQSPSLVMKARHVPAITPPTPPTNLEETQNKRDLRSRAQATDIQSLPNQSDMENSADEGGTSSPLQKIAKEIDSLDALQSELRDKVMPLSPVSSQTSSASSRSSGGSRRIRRYLYDRPDSSRAPSSVGGLDGTEFSLAESVRQGHESISIRSVSSFASHASHPWQPYRTSSLRQQLPRSPEDTLHMAGMDLFPKLKSRLREVPLRTPHYGNAPRTSALLQREMLRVVFGWEDNVESLIRDEISQHRPGSASGVLLSKWLGDVGADTMASMVGSESMTSSDWMMLALSAIGQDSQKKVGEAFVQRLLEKGDIHPAVAILLGLGEINDAIEVYVSQSCWLEAVLLTCLTCPSDWGHQAYLLRKWGEAAIKSGQAELAVRCLSCTSIETTETWTSPRAQQDAAYAEQQQRLTGALIMGSPQSPPNSPPSAVGSERMKAKNASLKLITTFGDRGATFSVNQVAATPIAESALSPGVESWREKPRVVRDPRDPSSARTATPGGFGRRKRLPSKSDIERAKQEAAEMATPLTAHRDFAQGTAGHVRSRSTSTASSSQGLFPQPTIATNDTLDSETRTEDSLPPPGPGVFEMLKKKRQASRDRKLTSPSTIKVVDAMLASNLSTGPEAEHMTTTEQTRQGALSPPLTGNSAKGRAVNEFISSVAEVRHVAREDRARSRGGSRNQSRNGRGDSMGREESRAGKMTDKNYERYIKPAKRSPCSPVPMSPEEVAQAKAEPATTDDEDFYKLSSPNDDLRSLRSGRSEPRNRHFEPIDSRLGSRRMQNSRGRSNHRTIDPPLRSPSLPPPMTMGFSSLCDNEEDRDKRFHLRSRSVHRRHGEDLQSRRAKSRSRKAQSPSTEPSSKEEDHVIPKTDASAVSTMDENASGSSLSIAASSESRRPGGLSRKELAAKELEERRMSLARRPSAPVIPRPGEFQPQQPPRPGMSPRSHTELGDQPVSFVPPLSRSQTVESDASAMNQRIKIHHPAVGLPATPRALRHPRYINADGSERYVPPIPAIPGTVSELSSLTGSSISQMTSSNLSQLTESNFSQSQGTGSYTSNSNLRSNRASGGSSSFHSEKPLENTDDVGPLLPSTVFSQKAPQSLPGRSSSAPIGKSAGDNTHSAYSAHMPPSNGRTSRGHVRKISRSNVQCVTEFAADSFSIDEALHASSDQQVIIIGEDSEEPLILPELQHLAGPIPPPPPPPLLRNQTHGQSNTDMINIAIDTTVSEVGATTLPTTNFPQPMERATTTSPIAERATTASPSIHRRGRNSVSESFGSRLKGVTDRMRSQSRGKHTKSPTASEISSNISRPYETILPPLPDHRHLRKDSLSGRAKSPYELAMASGGQDQQIPPPPPPPPSTGPEDGKLQETAIPPQITRMGNMPGYRNPKEIRANMPPESLQQGVFNGGFL